MGGEQQFFISRAGADAAFAAEIGRILEADGHAVKLQQWDFANSNFMLEMHEALTSGARVIALLSPEHMASDHCKAEWLNILAGDPLNRKHRLIVLRVVDCEPEGMLAGISYWDLVPIRDSAELVEEVVRDAVNVERRTDKLAAIGPYWRSPRTVIDFERIRPTPSFTGREHELSEIDKMIWNGTHSVAIHGMSGTGKSILAREYAWRYRDQYSVVWWLTAQTEAAIIDGLMRLGARLQPGIETTADRRTAAVYVATSLLSGFEKPVLLVFDNLVERKLLRAWSLLPGLHTLITSTTSALGADVSLVRLEPWSLEDAVRYLLCESGRPDLAPEASQIVARLGCLPLALSHAAAYFGRSRTMTAQSYLARIESYLAAAPTDVEYPGAVFATFQAAIATAEKNAPGAAAIVTLAAFFAPEAIPEELFQQGGAVYSKNLRPTLADTAVPSRDLRSTAADIQLTEAAIGELDRLSLVAFFVENRTFTIHRLVQLAARTLVGADDYLWMLSAVRAAESAFPAVDFSTWAVCDRLRPHVAVVLEAAPDEIDARAMMRLANQYSLYLRRRAAFAEGEAAARHALRVAEIVKGPSLATALTNLANALYDTNKLTEAETFARRAISVDENIYGLEHPEVATDLNNLAVLLVETNHFDEAERLYRRAITIDEASLGPEDPSLANRLNNLGTLLHERHRDDEAEPLLRRALAIDAKCRGPKHPVVANRLNNLSEVLRATHRDAEAETLCRSALAIRESAYGPDHPEVAISLNNLSTILSDQKRLPEAEQVIRRALAIDEKAYGPDNPNFAVRLGNLAEVLTATDRFEEAEQLCRRALQIMEANYAPNHPKVVRALYNLGAVLSNLGRYDEGAEFARRATKLKETGE